MTINQQLHQSKFHAAGLDFRCPECLQTSPSKAVLESIVSDLERCADQNEKRDFAATSAIIAGEQRRMIAILRLVLKNWPAEHGGVMDATNNRFYREKPEHEENWYQLEVSEKGSGDWFRYGSATHDSLEAAEREMPPNGRLHRPGFVPYEYRVVRVTCTHEIVASSQAPTETP